MVEPARYCPTCGTARPEASKFCANCGRQFEAVSSPATSATPAATFDANAARTVIAVQNFNLKVIIGRVLGLVAALALWYALILPKINEEGQALIVIATLPIAAFAGIFIGERMTLWALAK